MQVFCPSINVFVKPKRWRAIYISHLPRVQLDTIAGRASMITDHKEELLTDLGHTCTKHHLLSVIYRQNILRLLDLSTSCSVGPIEVTPNQESHLNIHCPQHLLLLLLWYDLLPYFLHYIRANSPASISPDPPILLCLPGYHYTPHHHEAVHLNMAFTIRHTMPSSSTPIREYDHEL